MGVKLDQMTRPYVGQNAQNIGDIKQVGDKKSGDVTSPPTPQVLRAWAFELAADGSVVVPNPPPPGPAPRPGRDPVVIELGQVEMGTRIELISLSDNPKADFDAKHAGEIFELPLTGYDVSGRTATIALNEEQMKEKGIVAGERLMLRQVDKDGNASEPVHVHLAPNGWENTNINEPIQGGGTQTVRGRQIDVNTGLTGLNGNPNPGKMEQVLGKTTTDVSAPKLLESNVSVRGETLNKSDCEMLGKYVQGMANLIGGGNYEIDHIRNTLDQNKASWDPHPTYGPMSKALREVIDDPKLFAKLSSFTMAASGQAANPKVIDWNQANALQNQPEASFVAVAFKRALEPGTTVTVLNSRTGESKSLRQSDTSRDMSIIMSNMKSGDPVIVTYTDAAGNAGKPYGFNYDEKAKDGKASTNPLNLRLSGFGLKPQTPPTQGT